MMRKDKMFKHSMYMIRRSIVDTLPYVFILIFSLAVATTSNATVASNWVKQIIGTQSRPVYSFVKDIDGDGDLDVVSTTNQHPGLQPSEVAWWQNRLNEGQSWDMIIIRLRTDEGHVDGATGVIIDDIDNDGRQDIIVASGEIGGMQGGVCWFKAPEDPTQGGAAWQRLDIDTTLANTYVKIYTIDINEDGWKDLIVSGLYGAVLFINPGSPDNGSAVWEKWLLPADTGVGMYLDDINEDGQIEVVNSLQLVSGNISWFDISYEAGETVFNRTMIASGVNSPFDVCSLRVNDDAHHDVVVSALNKYDPEDPGRLYWYKAPLTTGDPWIQYTISDNIEAADVYPGDIDGDGRSDFIVSVLGGLKISWFSNELSNDDIVWSEHVLDDYILIPGDITLIDVDGDGDLDVVTTSFYGNEVVWYENKIPGSTTTTTTVPSTTTTSIPPTLVTLEAINAVPGHAAVTLIWHTASEIDNAGFNIFRADRENGAYIKINDLLIPAQGAPAQGASYTYRDNSVKNRKKYFYKIEDIDLNGTSTMHGPVSATPRLMYGL